MRDVVLKIDDFELRKTRSLGKDPYEYYEIIKYVKDPDDKPYCFTIGTFEDCKDGFGSFKFVCDRWKHIDWKTFEIMLKFYQDNIEGD